MRSKQRAALKKLFSLPPHQVKPYYVFGIKAFLRRYTDICYQSALRMRPLGVKKWCSANVFSDTKQRYMRWKIC